MSSDPAVALDHVEAALEEVRVIPDVPPDTPVQPVDRPAVVGCGTMGGGIAMSFANAGIDVTVVDADSGAIDRGMAVIRRNYEISAARGKLASDEVEERLGRIRPTLELEDLSGADFVIEAVFEDMGLKKDLFRRLDALCAREAILATNTSTLDVDEIAAATARPDRVIGTHFFSPANVMRLMENVRGAESSATTIATAMELSRRLSKVGVLVRVCDGFVGNRMVHPYLREAAFLLEEGATPEQVDRVMTDFGFPMGPFTVSDLVGLDVGWRIREAQAVTRDPSSRYSRVGDLICEMGRFGQKTGAGWYRYEPGDRTPIPDPEIHALIEAESAALDRERRVIPDDEIVERCLYPLVNEGAKILAEGIALRPGDVDVIWILGYGFPRERGGPMFWADAVGVAEIHERLTALTAEHGEVMRPAPWLTQAALSGASLADLASDEGRL